MREPVCKRNELSSYSFYVGDRKYHKFDDVLLIVFFSHARYDVNLDYYKEVYSEFFPNVCLLVSSLCVKLTSRQMVFVGPGNREDLGFMHSYDVIVDSYQAEEDLSDPNNYKMAGRVRLRVCYIACTNNPKRWRIICYTRFSETPSTRVMQDISGRHLILFSTSPGSSCSTKIVSGTIHRSRNSYPTQLSMQRWYYPAIAPMLP